VFNLHDFDLHDVFQEHIPGTKRNLPVFAQQPLF